MTSVDAKIDVEASIAQHMSRRQEAIVLADSQAQDRAVLASIAASFLGRQARAATRPESQTEFPTSKADSQG